MKTVEIEGADLFCGAGGTSTGMQHACDELGLKLKLLAVNHWPTAIKTHTKNHGNAKHLCARLEAVEPRDHVPGGRLQLLVASPECTHHSRARGGKPMSDQSRSSAWLVLKWLQELYVENVLIENVKEFVEWGPLGADDKPLKSKKGQLFKGWCDAIEALGYKYEWRIINCANHGDATTRERFFMICKRGNKKISWPEETHARNPQPELFAPTKKKWRAAKEIIDWSIPGKSIFGRKKALAPATLKRIAAGLVKFNWPEPFLVLMRQHMDAQSVNGPVPTLTAGGTHVALCQPTLTPFVLGQQSGSVARSTDQPIPTVSTDGAVAVIQPFLAEFRGSHAGANDGNKRTRPLSEPLPTQDTSNRFGIVEPMLIQMDQGGRTHDVNKPMHTLTSADAVAMVQPVIFNLQRGKDTPQGTNEPLRTVTATSSDMGMVVPLLTPFTITAGGPTGQGRNPKSVDEPMGTVLVENHTAIVRPFVMPVNHGGADVRSHDIDAPMPAVTTIDAWSVIEPFITKYYGTADSAQSISQPLDTITAKDRFGIVTPNVITLPDGTQYIIDILFRMLQPEELAAAMGYDGYQFTGTREDKVKQIGNGVPERTARALCKELLKDKAPNETKSLFAMGATA